jgi:plasmid stabilization system protein ParE
MKYRVVTAATAQANLAEIYRYIAADNRVAARRFVADLRARIRTLASAPRRCPLAPETGAEGLEIRHLIYGEYRVIFLIEARRHPAG